MHCSLCSLDIFTGRRMLLERGQLLKQRNCPPDRHLHRHGGWWYWEAETIKKISWQLSAVPTWHILHLQDCLLACSCRMLSMSQTCWTSPSSTLIHFFLYSESQNCWGWKGALEVTTSNLLFKEGHLEKLNWHYVQMAFDYLQIISNIFLTSSLQLFIHLMRSHSEPFLPQAK